MILPHKFEPPDLQAILTFEQIIELITRQDQA